MTVMETLLQLAPETEVALSNDEIGAVFSAIDIPACPEAVTEALALAQRDSPDMNRLARAMAGDPGMVAAALRLANSATFGGGVPVSDIRAALTRLGIRNIVCVVIAAALRTSIKGVAPDHAENFWARATTIAEAARL
jgi:HD-like signal output (HDOD) protein